MTPTFLVLIISLILSPQKSQATFCNNYHSPQAYIEIKSKIDEKIRIFANKKSVAQRADELLSKLITAKSPVIKRWLNKRNFNEKKDDEIAREWRDYFARNFILTKYPHGDAHVDKDIETLMNEINKFYTNKVFQKKLQALFEKSKKSSMTVVKSFPIGEEQKKQIIERIEAIKLYWAKDFKSSKFKQLPLDFLDWGIAYDPIANEINIGVNSLSYPNDETYLAVFNHEIGHAFDSCRWGAFFQGEWPFQKIGDCLRSSKSVEAKKRDDSKMDLLAKENKELALSLKLNLTCNKLGYPPIGLQSDQLPESFADWFSAETMATIEDLKTSTLRTDLCESKELNSGSSYPTNELRLNAIYFSHPKLKLTRPDLKESSYQYCGWNELKI